MFFYGKDGVRKANSYFERREHVYYCIENCAEDLPQIFIICVLEYHALLQD